MTVAQIHAKQEAATGEEFERLFRAFRFARGQWEVAYNDPGRPDGLSDEENNRFSEAQYGAMLAFLAHPAWTPQKLAKKLRVVRDQEAWECDSAPEIMARLCVDAQWIASRFRGR
ncbi:MAG: hypothetical protein V2I27_00220 [Erythrobacter sp.]|jgi:hypothetical protein|nr:hypothetical protein [Erythrobacter sp.]